MYIYIYIIFHSSSIQDFRHEVNTDAPNPIKRAIAAFGKPWVCPVSHRVPAALSKLSHLWPRHWSMHLARSPREWLAGQNIKRGLGVWMCMSILNQYTYIYIYIYIYTILQYISMALWYMQFWMCQKGLIHNTKPLQKLFFSIGMFWLSAPWNLLIFRSHDWSAALQDPCAYIHRSATLKRIKCQSAKVQITLAVVYAHNIAFPCPKTLPVWDSLELESSMGLAPKTYIRIRNDKCIWRTRVYGECRC